MSNQDQLAFRHQPGLVDSLPELVIAPIGQFVIATFITAILTLLLAHLPNGMFLPLAVGTCSVIYYFADLMLIRSERRLTITKDGFTYAPYACEAKNVQWDDIQRAQWITPRGQSGTRENRYLLIEADDQIFKFSSGAQLFSFLQGRYSYWSRNYFLNDQCFDVFSNIMKLKIGDRAQYKLDFEDEKSRQSVRDLLVAWKEYDELWIGTKA